MSCRYQENISLSTDSAPPVSPSPFQQARADRHRLPGWTTDLVIQHGLGTLEQVTGSTYLVRLDGRASGPVYFRLSGQEIDRWRQGKRLSQVLGF